MGAGKKEGNMSCLIINYHCHVSIVTVLHVSVHCITLLHAKTQWQTWFIIQFLWSSWYLKLSFQARNIIPLWGIGFNFSLILFYCLSSSKGSKQHRKLGGRSFKSFSMHNACSIFIIFFYIQEMSLSIFVYMLLLPLLAEALSKEKKLRFFALSSFAAFQRHKHIVQREREMRLIWFESFTLGWLLFTYPL